MNYSWNPCWSNARRCEARDDDPEFPWDDHSRDDGEDDDLQDEHDLPF